MDTTQPTKAATRAKLSQFTRDPKRLRDGEWINPGPEYLGVEILTKAQGPAYHDEVAALTRRAARIAGGQHKIKTETSNEITVEALIKHCLLDIRGLDNDDGTPVTFQQFCQLLYKREHEELVVMCLVAVSQVGMIRDVGVEDAEGNSRTASAGS